MNWKITDPRRINDVLAAVHEKVQHAIRGGDVLIEVKRPSRNADQNAKIHAMITDISKTVSLRGESFGCEAWKAILVDEFDKEMQQQGTPLRHPGRTVPSLDHRRAVTIRASTAKMTKAEGSQFIEFLYQQGAELGAQFNERAAAWVEAEMRSRG